MTALAAHLHKLAATPTHPKEADDLATADAERGATGNPGAPAGKSDADRGRPDPVVSSSPAASGLDADQSSSSLSPAAALMGARIASPAAAIAPPVAAASPSPLWHVFPCWENDRRVPQPGDRALCGTAADEATGSGKPFVVAPDTCRVCLDLHWGAGA